MGHDYNVHVTDSIYRSSHIDSTLIALRPGLILVNSARASEKNLPKVTIQLPIYNEIYVIERLFKKTPFIDLGEDIR